MAYNLGPVKPHVAAAANEVGPRFGITTIYGWRRFDPFPDHPSGLALDYMTRSKSVGDAIVEYHIQHASRLNVKYIIWWQRIWRPATGWKIYALPNPHTDHVHVTYLGEGISIPQPTAPIDVTDIPGVGKTQGVVEGIRDLLAVAREMAAIAKWLNNPANWKRIALFGGGAILALVGLIRMDIWGVSDVASKIGPQVLKEAAKNV